MSALHRIRDTNATGNDRQERIISWDSGEGALDLKGKAAVVTGSSSDGGVGAECAKILASRGCNVVVNYATNAVGADAIAADCKAAGVEAVAVQADVADDGDCRRLVQAALDQ